MLQSRTSDQEQRLVAERLVKYTGTARVKLEFLHFPNEPRELNLKNVERLKKCFQTEGCYRLVLENRIPAIIDASQLNDALQASGILATELLSHPKEGYPELKFPAGYQLTCLHGRHRIQAGREVLARRNAWWAVDLYLAGMDIFWRATRASSDVTFCRQQQRA